MSFPKERLETYQHYYRAKLELVREFDNGTGHPVALFIESRNNGKNGIQRFMSLKCACDFEWQWQRRKVGKKMKRILVYTRDAFHCHVKNDARAVVRKEVYAKYAADWAKMSMADVLYDIFQKSRAGEFMGEFNIGMLYLQDVEELLQTPQEQQSMELPELKDADGNIVSDAQVTSFVFPSTVIFSAMSELKKRKLLDLSGYVIVPYKEHFRFPEKLHHQFAYWIEEPLGWPNGDAGDCFMFELYRQISAATGWTSGEVIFGSDHIPDFAESVDNKCLDSWFTKLDPRLTDPNVDDKSLVIRDLTIPQWVTWLCKIHAKLSEKST